MSLNLGIIASSRSSAPSAALLLDTYTGAAAAYSLRKLRSAYSGSAIRVRRSSDNTETDIGFVSNILDVAALTTFCGSGNGFVKIWYDQSGNNKNLTQLTNSSQPRIVTSGVVNTQNGKPIIVFESMFFTTNAVVISSTSLFTYVGNSKTPTTAGFIIYNSSPNDNPEMLLNSSNFFYTYWNGGLAIAGINLQGLTYSNFTLTFSGSITNSIYRNGALGQTSTRAGAWSSSVNELSFGRYTRTAQNTNGQLQEFVLYNSNQNTNRTGIETNINSFYSIY